MLYQPCAFDDHFPNKSLIVSNLFGTCSSPLVTSKRPSTGPFLSTSNQANLTQPNTPIYLLLANWLSMVAVQLLSHRRPPSPCRAVTSLTEENGSGNVCVGMLGIDQTFRLPYMLCMRMSLCKLSPSDEDCLCGKCLRFQ